SYIGGEHLLIGLLREDGGVAGRVLRELGLETNRVRTVVERLTGGKSSGTPFSKIELAPSTKRVLEYALEEAGRMNQHYVSTEHLLLGMVRQSDSRAVEVLRKFGVTQEQIRRQTRRMLRENPATAGATETAPRERSRRTRDANKKKEKSKTPMVDQLATDLTAMAEEGKLDPVIGRQSEIERVIQVLARRRKNNPALVGEPGVGKSAIVEGLAQRIVAGKVPSTLYGKRVLQLDVGSLVAGTMYRGQFEERLKRVIEELKQSDAILFIDEVHMLVGAGAAGSSVDAANILKPSLARGELQCVGATTLEEYRKHIESDAALERRFQPVRVDEPSAEESILILHGVKGAYEAHHNLTITDEAIVQAVKLSERYVTERFLPDKAIDLIDEGGSRVRLYRGTQPGVIDEARDKLADLRERREVALSEGRFDAARELREEEDDLQAEIDVMEATNTAELSVHPEDIAEVLSMWTGIPITQLTQAESQRLLSMEDEMRRHIIGQDEAITAIAKAVRRARSGLKDPSRPIGSFIFLGPTGVGKTELTKTLARFLFGTEDALIQLDMSEFMERHTVSRLIGSPPGYVGYDDAGQLTEAIRRRPYSIVVFDEIEKAHPDIFNLLLQIMEEGHLTDSKGATVDFRNAMIIMTSNVGASTIKRGPGVGFSFREDEVSTEDTKYRDMKKQLLEQLKRYFRPEFLNRVDSVIVFRELTQEHTLKIVDILLAQLNERLEEYDLIVEATDEGKKWLAEKGYNREFGARPLRRLIQSAVEDELSDRLLAGAFVAGDTIGLDVEEDELIISKKDDNSAEKPLVEDALPA
ncbi:MAG: ATP-dependent Clp protease ATP-binding subunit, partial [Candidatus Promineifilaceae bacterium]